MCYGKKKKLNTIYLSFRTKNCYLNELIYKFLKCPNISSVLNFSVYLSLVDAKKLCVLKKINNIYIFANYEFVDISKNDPFN